MAESVQDIVKRGSIYIPPNNRRMSIKRVGVDGTYESEWIDISEYVQSFGELKIGFPDGVFVGEFNEEDVTVVLDNNTRRFNGQNDPDSIFFGYLTRHRTKFKIEIYAADKDDNDVLLRAWYGLLTGLPTVQENGTISINLCSTVKILQNYPAIGIDQTATTTDVLVSRLLNKEQAGVSIFSRFFEGFSINPDEDTCMTISHPTIEDKDTVLDKLRDYSLYQNFFYYVDNSGVLVWTSRNPTDSTIWELNGAGSTDSTYGVNIVGVNSEVEDVENTFTRVVINYKENGIPDEKEFSGVRNAGDTSSLSDGNSLTIFNWLKTNSYLDTTTYRVAHKYVTDRSTVYAYFVASWSGYEDGCIDKLDKLVKSDSLSVSESSGWSVGDGSITDIYGEKTLTIDKGELIQAEATAVAQRLYAAYKNTKKKWEIQVFGLFQLFPKDKLEVNYVGEITALNPFILGDSLLGGTDVLSLRSGGILIDGEIVVVEAISLDLDTFDIIVTVSQV